MIGIPSSAFATGHYYIEPLHFLVKIGEPFSNIRAPDGSIAAQVMDKHAEAVLEVISLRVDK